MVAPRNIMQIDGKYYDFGTSNSSFLLTAQELKTLGIKNWYFMLEIKYPSTGVQDLDPYSDELTEVDAGKIIYECKNNPWFFFREVARVPVGGAGNVPPILTRASAAACWCFIHSFDFKLCQPRQTYKSTWCNIILEYMFLFEYRNNTLPMMHLTLERCEKSAELWRDYVMALPKYMNPWYGRAKVPGVKSLKYDEHNTALLLLSQPKNADDARNKLRGLTSAAGMFEEYEYLQHFADVMEGGGPAIISAREIARQYGIRTCIMMLSTPGNLETEEGRAAQNMIDATPRFNEQMYDLPEEEVKKMFEPVEMPDGSIRKPISSFYIEFNYKQLRKTEAWVDEQYTIALQSGRIDEYKRGVLLQRYRGADAVLFAQQDIDYMISHVREPKHVLFLLNKFNMYIYEHNITHFDLHSDTPYFDTQIPYLIGVDVSAGGNGDNTTMIIVNPYTLEIAAELSSPYIGALDLMRLITVVAKLVPRGIFCLETNSIGKAIVDFVQESRLEHRFYHDPKLDMAKNTIQKNEHTSVVAKKKAEEKYYIGTYVTPAIRNNMMDLLKSYVKEYKHLLNSKFLVKDITNLTRFKNGKIAAMDGEHDDMVMAFLHVLYVLHYGAELGRFGIDKTRCTYQQERKVIKQYEQELTEEQVNNLVPYENPNAFENQLLRDLVQTSQEFASPSGQDVYGYRHNQYAGTPEYDAPHQQEILSASDMAYFSEVNSYFGL